MDIGQDRSHVGIALAPGTRPVLRGYLHAGATVAALLGTIVLFQMTMDNPVKQISLLVYGASSILLFGCSALYHIPPWSSRRRSQLRRLDQSNIFLVIAGTYTPITATLLTGGWRVGLLTAVWMLALAGILTVNRIVALPRHAVTALYMAVGWVAVVALPEIVTRLSAPALTQLALGGLVYTLGALIYTLRWPSLWPRVWGYHEVFHLTTVAAAVIFFIFMLQYVVP